MSVAFEGREDPAGEASSQPDRRVAGLPVPFGWTPTDHANQASDDAPPIIDLFAVKPERDAQASAASAPGWRRIAAAVSLATVVSIGVAAGAVHVGEMRAESAEAASSHAIADRLDTMSSRIASLETNRSHDEIANLRKVLAEIKSGVASTRTVGDAVAQLGVRVDRLEKEQGGKLDKLGDRIDRDAAGRLADVAARLDKLEAKANAAGARDLSGPVAQLGDQLDRLEKDQAARLDKLGERLSRDSSNKVAELSARVEKLEAKPSAPVAAVAAKPSVAASSAARIAPPVSDETTGSIDRPPPRLRGFYLADVRNGYAMVDSPAGEIAVGPGDRLPGGGRVLRIERHGRDWAVITTAGQIVASDD
jgi:hypothetical protein